MCVACPMTLREMFKSFIFSDTENQLPPIPAKKIYFSYMGARNILKTTL